MATGANNQMPDLLSRPPLSDVPGADIDDPFPDDSPSRPRIDAPEDQY